MRRFKWALELSRKLKNLANKQSVTHKQYLNRVLGKQSPTPCFLCVFDNHLKKKHPPERECFFIGWLSSAGLAFYLYSLKAFAALFDIKSHLIPFAERTEATALNCSKVNENITMLLRLDKTKPLFVIEPLYCSLRPLISSPPFDIFNKKTIQSF